MKNHQCSFIKTYLQNNDKIIIEHLYKLNYLDDLININIFSSNNTISLNTNCSILPLYEAKYIYDHIFTWDLLSLELVKDFPNPYSIWYLQLDELPWINHGYMPYQDWEKLFDNPKINIITNNEDTKKIIDSTWNNKAIFIDQLNLKVLYELL